MCITWLEKADANWLEPIAYPIRLKDSFEYRSDRADAPFPNNRVLEYTELVSPLKRSNADVKLDESVLAVTTSIKSWNVFGILDKVRLPTVDTLTELIGTIAPC